MVVRLSRYRLLALLCGVLAALTLTTPALATPSALGTVRSDAAAGWLARQLVDGERFESIFDGVAYPDQGLTLDAVFAFASAGVADTFGAQAMAWVSRPDIRDGYIGDGTTEAYAGATAKLALAVTVRGGDPTDVGGVDLVARLRSLQTPAGRFSDRSAWGDYSNAFSQSFAILALSRTAQGVPSAAGQWLAGTRCPDGGYPLLPAQPTCVSDVDATAMTVQALRVAGRSVDAAAGLRWLVSVQRADGSFVNGGGTPNANSTGLAAQALRDGGRPLAWLRARVFLAGLQVGCAAAAANRGAVRLDGGAFDPATAPRATAQAVLGLTGTGYAQLSAASAAPGDPVLRCR
ncbi:peptidase [Micromonospora fluostatini]|uniref:Peptidase n=1 Tax=Micromonospora fluostatini TaxID=1629071 RepID=A0ABY2DHI7_9ACTN|nr:peptidase [Micromonospora fluostatini]